MAIKNPVLIKGVGMPDVKGARFVNRNDFKQVKEFADKLPADHAQYYTVLEQSTQSALPMPDFIVAYEAQPEAAVLADFAKAPVTSEAPKGSALNP